MVREGQEAYLKKNHLLSLTRLKLARALLPDFWDLDLLIGINYLRLGKFKHAVLSLKNYISFQEDGKEKESARRLLLQAAIQWGDELEKDMYWQDAVLAWETGLAYANSEEQARFKGRIHHAIFAKGAYHFGLNQHLDAALDFSRLLLDSPPEDLVKRIRRLGVNLFYQGAKFCEANQMPDKAKTLYRVIYLHFRGYAPWQEAKNKVEGVMEQTLSPEFWLNVTPQPEELEPVDMQE
ncbi:MAG: hypothetical protein H3C47_08225 [Candidatus Cloacimonetes bacterium]|nr:hypothetical protein [Candidatus Cloacimonadota bacterium]